MSSQELRYLSSGVHAEIYIYRYIPPNDAERSHNDAYPNLRAVKIINAGPSGKRVDLKPHNALKEVLILEKLDHPNIVKLLEYSYYPSLRKHYLQLPFYPLTLRTILDNPSPSLINIQLIKSLSYQLLSAIKYLHDPKQDLAHRDINPLNILIDWDGILKIIDFGTAWAPGIEDLGEEWKEEGERGMVCQIGTGPYRAPELLVGPTTYDAKALDLWSTGCVIAEFFTPFILDSEVPVHQPSGNVSYEDTNDYDPLDGSPPFESGSKSYEIIHQLHAKEGRKSLFDCTWGEIGLAGSIFKIRGSPTKKSWPSFQQLPDAQKISFEHFDTLPLQQVLPNLNSLAEEEDREPLLALIDSLLQLEPSRRITASRALQSSFYTFKTVVLPEGYPAELAVTAGSSPDTTESTQTLLELLQPWMEAAEVKLSRTFN